MPASSQRGFCGGGRQSLDGRFVEWPGDHVGAAARSLQSKRQAAVIGRRAFDGVIGAARLQLAVSQGKRSVCQSDFANEVRKGQWSASTVEDNMAQGAVAPGEVGCAGCRIAQ